MNYQEAIEYLYNSAPMFQNLGGTAYKEGLQTTLALDEHFNHPHQNYKTIHVGGTNGKGSCSHTLTAILQEAGYKVGLYTSPHLTDFRERIRVNGEMIPEEKVVEFIEKERDFFEPFHPSFFELTTALAFKHFAEEEVDVAVIEVGLGGRLDCTNIIRPDLSIITNISFDHVQFLGHTLQEIAQEKAGIIKASIPVIIGETTTETKKVFQSKSLEMNAFIRFAEEEHQIKSSHTANGFRIYETKDYGILRGALNGLCQEKNTATILTAVNELQKQGYKIQTEHIKKGFLNVCQTTGLRGRWQKISDAPIVICDTGHNMGGMSYIAEQLKNAKADKIHIIIGMVNDKDIRNTLRLLPTSAFYYFTRANVKRALDESELQSQAQEVGLKGKTWPNVESAFHAAQAAAGTQDLIFIGGSTFVVADFLTFHSNNQA